MDQQLGCKSTDADADNDQHDGNATPQTTTLSLADLLPVTPRMHVSWPPRDNMLRDMQSRLNQVEMQWCEAERAIKHHEAKLHISEQKVTHLENIVRELRRGKNDAIIRAQEISQLLVE